MKERALATNNQASQGLQALFKEHAETKKQTVQPDFKAMDKLKRMQDKENTTPPQTINELHQLLKNVGKQWREDHKETKKKNGQEVEIIHRVPARSIAYMLEKVIKFAVIGDNEKEIENAPLTFYNLDTGLYTKNERLLDQFILAVDDTTNTRARKDIREWLRIESKSLAIESNINLVPVGNGIYNKQTQELLPFSPKYVFTSKVSTPYITETLSEPNFNGWSFSQWIEELSNGDENKTTLLWQMIASVIQNRRTSNVLFCLIDDGRGRTGKSTFETLLMNLVGKDNYTALKLEEFDHPFLLAQAYGASLVIGDDNDPKGFIDNGSALKSIVTNELVLINPKGQRPFSAKFYCTIVQSMNGFPRFKDTSNGLYRRFRLIQFNHQYPDTADGRKVKDEYIKDHRLLEWILKQALQINIDTIINTQESQQAVQELQLENDIVLSFVNEIVPNLESTRIPISLLFALFRKYADDNNNKNSMTRATFTRRVKPLMEHNGWAYKNSAPTTSLSDNDINQLKVTPYYDYNDFRKNDHKVQRCFVKE